MDARVNTAGDLSTSGKNMINFGPVTPEFCRRVCAGRTTRSALASILFNHIRQMAPILKLRA